MAELFEEWYGDLYLEGTLNEKCPRWRVHYEITGRTDKIFRGAKRMEIKAVDALKSFKYLDKEKTRVNLNDPTNKLILDYQNKRVLLAVRRLTDSKPCTTKEMEGCFHIEFLHENKTFI